MMMMKRVYTDKYLAFAQERQRIWEERQSFGAWRTDDPILATHKFTNVYRIHDQGSQYVLRLVRTARTSRDALARAALYRYTNRPEPWEYFLLELGRWPTASDMIDGTVHEVWSEYDALHLPFFSSSYTMFSGCENPGVRRWEWALGLCAQIAAEGDPFLGAEGVKDQVQALLPFPRVGQFMAQQITTDYNLSRFWSGGENDFVYPGPGSMRGAAVLDPGVSEESFGALVRGLKYIVDELISIPLAPGCSREPSLMDIQNTLCEFGKYIRWTAKPLRRKPYAPSHPGVQPTPEYPQHWTQEV